MGKATSVRTACAVVVAVVAAALAPAARAALPPGFTEQVINRPDGQPWNEAVGLAFSPTGRLFVWERAGSVWVVDPVNPRTSRFLDLRDEVAAYSDYGMLGLALHPNFNVNGYLYVLFVVAASICTLNTRWPTPTCSRRPARARRSCGRRRPRCSTAC